MSTESVKSMTYIERGDYYQDKTFCRLDTDVLTWRETFCGFAMAAKEEFNY